jgi:hypothetical protein
MSGGLELSRWDGRWDGGRFRPWRRACECPVGYDGWIIFWNNIFLSSTLKVEALCSSETFFPEYQTPRCRSQKHHNMEHLIRENTHPSKQFLLYWCHLTRCFCAKGYFGGRDMNSYGGLCQVKESLITVSIWIVRCDLVHWNIIGRSECQCWLKTQHFRDLSYIIRVDVMNEYVSEIEDQSYYKLYSRTTCTKVTGKHNRSYKYMLVTNSLKRCHFLIFRCCILLRLSLLTL